MRRFTKEDLAQNNGKLGRPAYVAVNGIVYDVTNNNHWAEGNADGFTAGIDMSDKISQTAHGREILHALNKVGILV